MSEKILKGSGSGDAASPSKVVKSTVYEGGRTAEGIIEQARTEADELLSQAKQERAALIEEARQKGYDEGLAIWNRAIAEAAKARDAHFADSEERVLRLAVRVAEKILGETLRSDPERIASIVREALKSARQANSITIRVHPDAAGTVEKALADLRLGASPGAAFAVKPDESVAAGGCVIQTEFGTVDARLESQLRCLEELIVREIRR